VVLLETSHPEGQAQIMTANLDGETNLKTMQANSDMMGKGRKEDDFLGGTSGEAGEREGASEAGAKACPSAAEAGKLGGWRGRERSERKEGALLRRKRARSTKECPSTAGAGC
jgi:hypothetical protein